MLAFGPRVTVPGEPDSVLAHVIWFGTIALEVCLLGRALRTELFTKFPVFYSYVLFVLLQSLTRLMVYHWHAAWYLKVYWYTEFISIFVGSGVLFEIYWRGLAPYPGTARLARNVLAFVFVFAVGKALLGATRGHLWWPSQTTAELERNLRGFQAFAILALVILLLAYSIPLGRNLRGIVMGYGLLIVTSLVSLTALAYLGAAIEHVWSYSQQFFYLLVLLIWTVALWTVSPQQGLAASTEGQPSYGEVELKTRERWKRIRLYFGRRKDR